MHLTLETTTNTLLHSALVQTPVSRLEAKRGSGEHLVLELLRDGVPWQAPGGCQFVFVVKAPGVFAGDALASASAFTLDPAAGRYEAAITYEVAALDQRLLIGAERENSHITLQAEVAWLRPSMGSWRRSQTVELVLHNNVWRGSEASPALPSGSLLRPIVKSIAQEVENKHPTANTLLDVTGLSFPVEAGKRYGFRFFIPYTAAATTTGSRWTINGPAFSALSYRSQYTLTATTETTNNLSAYNAPANANATSLLVGNVAIIEGVVAPTASGNVIARFASEVANSSIKALPGAHVTHYEMP
jgi:hypothetical protein